MFCITKNKYFLYTIKYKHGTNIYNVSENIESWRSNQLTLSIIKLYLNYIAKVFNQIVKLLWIIWWGMSKCFKFILWILQFWKSIMCIFFVVIFCEIWMKKLTYNPENFSLFLQFVLPVSWVCGKTTKNSYCHVFKFFISYLGQGIIFIPRTMFLGYRL